MKGTQTAIWSTQAEGPALSNYLITTKQDALTTERSKDAV